MDITLLRVRQVLSPAFGIDSFAVNMIRGVRENKNMAYPTMCMCKDGWMEYDPKFIRENIETDQDLFCLVTHEFLHLALNHFIHDVLPDSIEHIAVDAVCNSMITNLWPDASGNGEWFTKLYNGNKIPNMLLRPGSQYRGSIVSKLYRAIWGGAVDNRLTTLEIINVMKTLIPHQIISRVLLLGNHGDGKVVGDLTGFDREMAERFLRELKRNMQDNSQAGFAEHLVDELVNMINSNLALKRQLLAQYATSAVLSKYLAPTEELERQASPLMLDPSSRDLINLINLHQVWIFHNREEVVDFEEQYGTAVYIDASGSVTAHLPDIIAILNRAKSQLSAVYWFSNQVVEANVRDLTKVRTTGGTDFDCVAGSILENGYKKCVVFTDGWASMTSDNQNALDTLGLEMLTIMYTESRKEDHVLNRWGPSMAIEDAVDTYKFA